MTGAPRSRNRKDLPTSPPSGQAPAHLRPKFANRLFAQEVDYCE
jgi:hypothetical protein